LTCAGNFTRRAAIIRFVRPFSRPCDDNSTGAGNLAFRASQLSLRAGKDPFVRPFFDLCEEKALFMMFLAVLRGQKATFESLSSARIAP
jgi:hypothetical protein